MVHRWQFLLCRKDDDFIAVRVEEWVAQYQHGRDGMLSQSRKGGIEFGVSACVKESKRLTDRVCRRSQSRHLPISPAKLRIEQDAKESGTGKSSCSSPSCFNSSYLQRSTLDRRAAWVGSGGRSDCESTKRSYGCSRQAGDDVGLISERKVTELFSR